MMPPIFENKIIIVTIVTPFTVAKAQERYRIK